MTLPPEFASFTPAIDLVAVPLAVELEHQVERRARGGGAGGSS